MHYSANTLANALRKHRSFDVLRTLFRFAAARMRDAQLQEVASSMTLTTLLAMVPILAVSLALFAAFPGFQDARQALEDAIFNSFLPPRDSEVILNYIRQFASHASGLGIFGVVGLAVTGLFMIDKFFVTVNRLFKVRVLRPWPQRALIYWAMLTLGPAAIALSITMSTQAIRLAAGAAQGLLPGWLLAFLQVLFQSVAYAVLFKFVPNCRVPLANALAGGFFVAFSGQIVRQGFEIYVTAGTMSSIYGAFVAVPAFLLWVYLNWLLIFTGAAVSATIPLLTSGRFSDFYRKGNDFLTGLALLRVLVYARKKNAPAVPADILAKEVDSYPQAVDSILATLSRAGYCGEVRPFGMHHETSWALLCDPKEKTLREAFDALLLDAENTLVSPKRIGQKRDEGVLFDWHRRLIMKGAIDAPIDALLESGEKMPFEVFMKKAEEDAEEVHKAGEPSEKTEA